MAKKTPFEITAAALKIMGKKISAKKGSANTKTECVFVPANDSHAIATDGHIIAILDLNKYGNYNEIEILSELAFYADMQVISFLDGHAMITAEKKEDFVSYCGKGIEDPTYEELKDTMLQYPEVKRALPPAEALQHVSMTGAIHDPGRIGLLDNLADAFDVLPIGDETIANHLYGAESEGLHICILSGLMLAAMPLKQHKEEIGVVPSKFTIQSFFKETVHEQTEMDFDSESDGTKEGE